MPSKGSQKLFLDKKYLQQPIGLEEEEETKRKKKNRKQQEKEIVSESFHKFEIDSKRVFSFEIVVVVVVAIRIASVNYNKKKIIIFYKIVYMNVFSIGMKCIWKISRGKV